MPLFDRKTFLTLALSVAFLLAPAGASQAHGTESHTNFGMKLLDGAVVRPISMVGAFAGTGVYLATWPLTFFTNVATEAADVMVVVPWRWTARRHLGDFLRYQDGRDVMGRAITASR